jgi:hypothetical protein
MKLMVTIGSGPHIWLGPKRYLPMILVVILDFRVFCVYSCLWLCFSFVLFGCLLCFVFNAIQAKQMWLLSCRIHP